MDQHEVALRLTLELLEKGIYFPEWKTNVDVGEKIAELYNTIYKNIAIETPRAF